MHTHMHTCLKCTYSRIHTYIFTHAHIPCLSQAHMHTYIHTCIHAYIVHIHMQTFLKCTCSLFILRICVHICIFLSGISFGITAIPIIIEGRFQNFQRFSSSKLILITVESSFLALNYYGNGIMESILIFHIHMHTCLKCTCSLFLLRISFGIISFCKYMCVCMCVYMCV